MIICGQQKKLCGQQKTVIICGQKESRWKEMLKANGGYVKSFGVDEKS